MNIVQTPEEATYAASLFDEAQHKFPGQDVLIVFKRKSGAWALHSPTNTEAASMVALLSDRPRNSWEFMA